MCQIFISYNWNDSTIVQKFYDKLLCFDYTVWRDIKSLNQTNESLTLQLGYFFILELHYVSKFATFLKLEFYFKFI